MTKSVTIAQARQADQHTIKTIGIPSLVLMERAALGATARLQPDTFDLTHVLVFAGTGNNGGDGLAIARMLHVRGIDVTVMLTGDAHKTSVETGQQLAILSYYHIPIIPASTDLTGYTTIVDAIFGIGLIDPFPVSSPTGSMPLTRVQRRYWASMYHLVSTLTPANHKALLFRPLQLALLRMLNRDFSLILASSILVNYL